MKIHIDTSAKTISLEGRLKVADVFNRLMSWFPEDWEEWYFIEHVVPTTYKEIIVQRDWWNNPYWRPSIYYGNTIGGTNPLVNNASLTAENTSSQITLNLNSI